MSRPQAAGGRTPQPVRASRMCPCGAQFQVTGQPPDIQMMLVAFDGQHLEHQTPEYLAPQIGERFHLLQAGNFPLVALDTPQGDVNGDGPVSRILWPHHNGHRYRNPVATPAMRGVADGVYAMVPMT